MHIDEHGPRRIDVKQFPPEEFFDYVDAFNRLSGAGDEFLLPRLFKGAAKAWDIDVYNLERLIAEFGELKVPVFREWNTGFQQADTLEQIPLSEHIKNTVISPTEAGYLLGAIDDQGIGQPDPASEAVSCEEFRESRANRSHIISSLVKNTHLQRVTGGTTTIFFGGRSITPLHQHQPVFLLQVFGKKKTSLIAPRFAKYVYRQSVSRYAHNLIDFNNIDLTKYPLLKQINIFDAFLEPGDVLFIPNRWFHYVEALEFPSLSLSRFTKPEVAT